MKVTIVRNNEQPAERGHSVLFPAHDEAGVPLTVDVSKEAWAILVEDANPLDRVEEMANSPRAGWTLFGAERNLPVYM
jgi:hypothetical protein